MNGFDSLLEEGKVDISIDKFSLRGDTQVQTHETPMRHASSLKGKKLQFAWVRFTFAFIAPGLVASASTCRASVIILGPTFYHTAADSPFPIDGSDPRFFLEDFEDGALNAPGILQPLAPVTHGIVLGPGSETHSVDGDDGEVDGQGSAGYSLASSAYGYHPTDPPRSWSTLTFSFDATALGFLPNSFGFVWTHGIPESRVQITLFDSEWGVISSNIVNRIGDGSGSPSIDDRFFGLISDRPFAAVEIISFYPGLPNHFQIDHLQYGLTIPEPAGLLQAAILAIGGSLIRQRRYDVTTLPSQ